MSIQNTTQQQTATEEEPPSLYENAHPLDIQDYFGWRIERFIDAVNEEIELGVHKTPSSTPIEWDNTDAKVSEVYQDPLQLLLVYEDETRQYVGQDETSKEGSQLFTFYVRPEDDYPMVRTVEEALALLKPPGVQDALITSEVGPKRQGEWWLLERDEEPESDAFSPGVNERPFGYSPLDNHIPTRYALGVDAETFMERFEERVPHLAADVESPEDVFRTLSQGRQLDEWDDFDLLTEVPDPMEVRELADGVFVKGTLRHRDSEHYMESIGEEWHRAVTHDMDVWTVDAFELTQPSPTVRYD